MAVMSLPATLESAIVKLAAPWLESNTVAKGAVMPFSVNVTEPVGVPMAELTLAVKVTDTVPDAVEVARLARVTAVGAGPVSKFRPETWATAFGPTGKICARP